MRWVHVMVQTHPAVLPTLKGKIALNVNLDQASEFPRGYSHLSATMGSIFAARRAGT